PHAPAEAPLAVPLVDDVVMLGVEPATELRVPAERVDRAMIVPAPVHVTGTTLVAPDVAELGVEHRLSSLLVGRFEIPRRLRSGRVAQARGVGFPRPAGAM